jgi:PAS domain S-box-containing protein
VPLASIFNKHRDRIIRDWVEKLHASVSERYSARPLDELYKTVAGANDASFAVLVNNDYSLIDAHIEWITGLRLEGDFSLAEVQHAYELYRTIVLPIFLAELTPTELSFALKRLNHCLFYTITRFSNYFQSVHEKQIREYAHDLEREVEKRTGELSESEAKYRMLVEEINDGYFVNQHGRIVFANRAFCDMHGYLPSEVIGKQFTDFIAEDSLPSVTRLYDRRISAGEGESLYTYYRLNKDGESRPTENKVQVITFQGDKAVAGICRDITERIEMERRIRESERFAHIGQLTTSLAHEIRNPLSAIKINVQILSKNLRLDGNDRKRGQIIAKEISRLERILTEMLDSAKPLRLTIEPVSINDIIDSCLDILFEKIEEKHIGVKKRRSRHLPVLLLDRDKMEQAVINILLNSIEALAEGATISVLTRRSSRHNNDVLVDIHDDGPGIGEADLPYIFDPFFSSKKKGTGLGLYNVKKIVEAHGGAVRVTSSIGEGTQFRIAFPVRDWT